MSSKQVEYGLGGWCRFTGTAVPGALYVRYEMRRGRPIPVEMYVDGGGEELRDRDFREFGLEALSDWAWIDERQSLLAGKLDSVGPDMSTLAKSFATMWTHAGRTCDTCSGPIKGPEGYGDHALTDWVALGWLSQIPGSGIEPSRQVRDRIPEHSLNTPRPVDPPKHGLTDEFLQTVAQNYSWARLQKANPAPVIAAQTGHSVRTVHAWIRKARERGIMPPGRPKGGTK